MMGQPSVQISWVINRSPQDVYEFFSNMENSPQWGRTSRTTKVSKGPIAVGTIFNEETQLMGQTLTIRTEVVEYNPPSRFSYTGVFSNGMRERANLTFEPVDGGTRVTLAGETEMGKVASLFSPFFSWMMKRQMTALSKNLKEVLERQ